MKNSNSRCTLYILGALALGTGTSLANATTIVYSFSGATQGSFQEDSSYAYDTDTGFTYSPTYGITENESTGRVSFSLDVERFVDQEPLAAYAFVIESSPATPWLTSTSTVRGPHFSRTLTTSGVDYSALWAFTAEVDGHGYLNLLESLRSSYEFVEDELGRLISERSQLAYNSVELRGDVMFNLIDGKEAPVGIRGVTNAYIDQWDYEASVEYRYDDLGTQGRTEVVRFLRATLPIESWDVSIRQIPEPTSLLLMSLGLTALGLSRRQ